MKNLSLSIFALILLSSCNSVKLIRLLRNGSVDKEEFKTEIPFQMRLGLVVIQVVIEGKTYDFLVDTGAPNVCSKELAAELNLKTRVTKKTGDSQGVKEELDFVVFPDIFINGTCFKGTGAAVADLKQSEAIACLDIDGFIGANLMKEAIWEFDYERNVISISDKRSSFSIPEKLFHLPFAPSLSYTPLVTIVYNGVEDEKVTFDTGSNGSFDTSNACLAKIKAKKSPLKEVRSYGTAASGLYGIGKVDTSYVVLLDSTKIGDLILEENVVSIESGARLIGTKFLKNFRVIIDWNVKEILLIPTGDYNSSGYESFGFRPFISEDKLIVSKVYMGTQASEEGLKNGAQILQVNGVDYRKCSTDQFCSILANGFVPEDQNLMKLLVLIDGEEKYMELTKKDILK